MALKRVAVSVTTDASGDGTGYTPEVAGVVEALRYVKTDYDNTADFTITDEVTGAAILTVSNITASTTWNPRAATVDTAGVASLYAAAGEPVEGYIPVGYGRIKVVVAQGGNAKTGTFHFWVRD